MSQLGCVGSGNKVRRQEKGPRSSGEGQRLCAGREVGEGWERFGRAPERESMPHNSAPRSTHQAPALCKAWSSPDETQPCET